MAGGSENITQSEYIGHHLQNLTFGQHSDGSWGLAHSAAEAQAMGFWAFNVDTLFWAVILGVCFLLPVPQRGQKSQLRCTHPVPGGN